jgi:NitT/TauT family transport system substrate-binding protein
MAKKHRKPAKKRAGIRLVPPGNVVILVCLLSLLACAAFALLHIYNKPSQQKYTGPVENISTGLTGQYGSLILIAQEQGYFREHGLNVAVQEYDSGAPIMTDLLANKLDSGIASDFSGVRNSFHGEDIRIVGSFVKSQVFYLVARKDHGITAIKDLRGKRIGVTKGTAGEFYLGQFLTLNGLQLTDITITDGPPAVLMDAVNNGTLDGIVSFEPNVYNASKSLGTNSIRWSVQNQQPVEGLLFVTGQYVHEHPAALKRYMEAIIEAQAYLEMHNDAAKAFVAKHLGYDKAYIDYIWPKLSLDVSLDQDLLIYMEDEAQWAIENKLTTATTIPNYLQLIDFEPLESVRPESITVIR